jgi:hypothetical protein
MRIDRYFVGFQRHLEFIGRFSQKSPQYQILWISVWRNRADTHRRRDGQGESNRRSSRLHNRFQMCCGKFITKYMWYLLPSQVYITLSDFTACPSDPPPPHHQNTALVYSDMFLKIHVKHRDNSEQTETSFLLRLMRTNMLLWAAV